MPTIAAIDAGSNALRMLIGNVTPTGQAEPLQNIRLPVRLGEDVFASGALREKTIQQAAAAFVQFQRVAQDHGVVKLRAIGTSAMREAANRDILLDRIARTSGIEVEVISGAEEARLIHLAVANVVNLKGKRAVLIDIGGGSVEVSISENRNILSTESYNMGTVRLLQKLNGDKGAPFSLLAPKGSFTELVREYAEAARRRIDREIGGARVHMCVGTGGTVEDLGRLHQRLFKKPNDRVVSRGELAQLIELMDGMSLKERIRKLDLRPDRADVILPAAIVLHLIAGEARVRQVTVPHVGLKDGILLELAHGLGRAARTPPREQVLTSAMRLGRKFQFDAEHALLTAKLAKQLFDQSAALHELGQEERVLLAAGALLHDIGQFISMAQHDRHGYYILSTNPIIGLSDREQAVVANLVLYHRSSFLSLDNSDFQSLPQKERISISKLSALLRLADGMDVSHTQHVARAELTEKKKRWLLILHGRGEMLLEQWALEKRRELFEELFGVQLEIRAKN